MWAFIRRSFSRAWLLDLIAWHLRTQIWPFGTYIKHMKLAAQWEWQHLNINRTVFWEELRIDWNCLNTFFCWNVTFQRGWSHGNSSLRAQIHSKLPNCRWRVAANLPLKSQRLWGISKQCCEGKILQKSHVQRSQCWECSETTPETTDVVASKKSVAPDNLIPVVPHKAVAEVSKIGSV